MTRFLVFVLALVAALSVDLGAVSTMQAQPAVGADWLHYLGISFVVFGATLGTTHPTYLDFKSTLDPNDRIAHIIEMMAETNEVIDDMVVIEGNRLDGHESVIRSGIPLPTWRKLYGGVQPSKTEKVKVVDTCGMMENYSEVDKALADKNGQAAAFMLSESKGIIEGFNQEFADSLFYANEDTEPEAFTGLAPRFNSLSAENGQNIVAGGGSGNDNTSVWLVCWGEHAVHGIYPQGSKGGLQMTNKGQVTIESLNGDGGRMEAYRTHFKWDVGLVVADWRQIVRIANIDTSELVKTAATGADLVDLMTQALELVHSLNMGRPAFYCNRTVRSFLRRQIRNANNVHIGMGEVAGKKVIMFDEVPVRRCDAITNAEATVS